MRNSAFVSRFAVLACLFALSGAFVQAGDGFSCKAVPTLADKGMDSWYRVLPGTRPVVPRVSQVFPGQSFNVMVFFRDFALDEAGRVDLAFELSIHRPDGSLHERTAEITAYRGPHEGEVRAVLTKLIPTVFFKGEDPAGKYTLRIHARDRVSGSEYVDSVGVVLAPFSHSKAIGTDEDMERFITGYYADPRPDSLVFSYLIHAKVLEPDSPIGFNPRLLAFYRHVFAANPWLMPRLEAAWDEAGTVERRKLILLFKVLGRSPGFLDDLEITLEEFYQRAPSWQQLEPAPELGTPADADLFLAEFFATGRYGPVANLVRGLDGLGDRGLIARWQGGELERNDGNRQRVERAVNAETVRILLVSNGMRNGLMRSFMRYALVREELSEHAHRELSEILKAFPEDS